MPYDYQDDYAQQAEQLRLMQEAEQERQRLEAERAAQAQQQQAAPVDRSVGGMLAPQGPAPSPYDNPQTRPENPWNAAPSGPDPRSAAAMLSQPAAPATNPYGGPNTGVNGGAPASTPQEQPQGGPGLEPPAPAPVNPYVSGATSYYGGTAFPTGTATPDRKTSEMDLDQFNKDIRNSELYQQFTRQRGLGTEGAWGTGKWSEADRQAWKATLAAQGVQLPKGMKVDDGGNLNQVNTKNKKILIGAAIVGGTIATAGALGAFGGAAAAGGAGASAAGGAAAAGTAAGAGSAAAGTAAAAGAGVGLKASIVSGIAGLGSTYMGARAQTQAANQAAAATREAGAASERTITAQMQFEREQRAQERADAERRWAAEQEMASRMWAAQEDERLYQRKIFEEDRAAAQNRGGGGPSGPSGPDPAAIRRQQARQTLATLLAQGTPGYGGGGYTPATAAGPVGRG